MATEVITTAVAIEDFDNSLVSLPIDNAKGGPKRAASPISRVKNDIGSTFTVGAI